MVGGALRIGQDGKRPAVLFLVMEQPIRLGEGYDHNRNAPPLELRFACLHLAEVSLTRQSGQVPEQDQQQAVMKVIGKESATALQIQ